MIITSKDNQTLKLVRKLAEKKYRDEYGLYVVEGARAVADVRAYDPAAIEAILVAAGKAGVYDDELIVPDELFARIAETVSSQGVLAIVKKPLSRPSGSPYALYLDGIRDPGNLGTLLRTACAAGYNDVYLRDCADPYAGKVVRSTMSAIVKVNVMTADAGTLAELSAAGYALIGADMDGEPLYGFAAPSKLCVIVGGEADGITDAAAAMCDRILSIPMEGAIESLNAAVSGALMMYYLKFNK